MEYRYERSFGRVFALDAAWRLSTELAYEYSFRTARDIPAHRVHAETAATFPNWGDFGLFAAFFSGQDYYNLRFTDLVHYQFMVGLIADLYSRPIYRCRRSDPAECRN